VLDVGQFLSVDPVIDYTDPAQTIKRGSARTPGSGNPHVELGGPNGQRIDHEGNPVTRSSPANHTPIDWNLP
jgi:hypothetical protein